MLEYRDPAGLMIAQTDATSGHVTIIEPGHPLWAEAVAAGPAPYVAPEPAPDPVPRAVSRLQARLALLDAGLLSYVESALAGADVVAQMAWAEAVEFRRDSPTIAAVAAGLGLTGAQVDDLFRAAAGIGV